jgi:hypothetical protein
MGADHVGVKAPGQTCGPVFDHYRQQPRQGGDHGPVSPVRFRAGDLTAQHRDLVPQHQDLYVFGDVAAREQRQPVEHPDHEQIGEAEEHEC